VVVAVYRGRPPGVSRADRERHRAASFRISSAHSTRLPTAAMTTSSEPESGTVWKMRPSGRK
jgi:hypothetical protein